MLLDLGPLGMQTLSNAFLLSVGIATLSYIVYTFTKVLLSTFVIPGKSLSSFGSKGSWAVVTGASDGIGKEFARQIAAKGFNLILASRTQSKLDAVASDITSKYPSIKIETLSIDFASPTEQDYTSLSNLCSGKQVAILINNVGQSHSIPVLFAETSLQEMTNIIRVNCLATLRVTQLVLPHMVPQKRGLILTMGSFAGMSPTPYLATYSGSKAFLQQWSTALASELRPAGISVYFVQAYTITSAMSKIRRSNWQTPTEKAFVRSALAKIGNQCGSIGFADSGAPYWSHSLAMSIIIGIFGTMNTWLMEYNRNMHIGIRSRALKRAEREALKGKKST